MASKSTNVRFPPIPAYLPALIGPLSAVSPTLAGWLTVRLFETAPRRARTTMPASFERTRVMTRSGPVMTYRAGRGPVVYLVHGWGGSAAQMLAFAEPLLAAGYSVVAFDGPAHGASPGRTSPLPRFARAFEAVIASHGPPAGIVAHSFGCAVTALVEIRGLPPVPTVFIAPITRPLTIFRTFLERLSFSSRAIDAAIAMGQRHYDVSWVEIDALARAASQRSPLLVIHDREDRSVPVEAGRRLAAAWPGAAWHETVGLGHMRILRDAEVVARALGFVTRAERREFPAALRGAA